MRVIVLVLLLSVLIAAAWLSRIELGSRDPALAEVPPATSVEAPISMPQSEDARPVPLPPTSPESVTVSGNPWMEMSGPKTLPPQFTPDPDTRGNLIGYFVENGLAPEDSERIVDAAIEGFNECGRRASGLAHDDMRMFLDRCNQSVVQEAGLPTVGNSRLR